MPKVVRTAPEAFSVQVGHRRTAGALGNERNIIACTEKGGLDLGIGKEPGTGLPEPQPSIPPSAPKRACKKPARKKYTRP